LSPCSVNSELIRLCLAR